MKRVKTDEGTEKRYHLHYNDSHIQEKQYGMSCDKKRTVINVHVSDSLYDFRLVNFPYVLTRVCSLGRSFNLFTLLMSRTGCREETDVPFFKKDYILH